MGLTLIGWAHLLVTVLLVFLFLSCQGFIFPNATALALAPLGHNAGNASALIGAIQMTIGAGAAAILSMLENHTTFPMPAVMASCAIVAFTFFTLVRKEGIQDGSSIGVEEGNIEGINAL